jgi:hypothetical protein
MRITREELQRALDAAAQFNRLPLSFVGTSRAWRGAEERIRGLRGFVQVQQYGRGMLPLPNELGTNGKTRYLFKT